MFAVVGIPLKKTLGLNATEFGLLMAMPVRSGSLIRVPLGIWTDKYGGRIVMSVLLAITVPAIWLMALWCGVGAIGAAWLAPCIRRGRSACV